MYLGEENNFPTVLESNLYSSSTDVHPGSEQAHNPLTFRRNKWNLNVTSTPSSGSAPRIAFNSRSAGWPPNNVEDISLMAVALIVPSSSEQADARASIDLSLIKRSWNLSMAVSPFDISFKTVEYLLLSRVLLGGSCAGTPGMIRKDLLD